MTAKTMLAAATATAVAAGALALGLNGSAATAATPDPHNFTSPKANPYFPLTPGLVLHYRGTDDGEHEHEKLTVTYRRKTIQGVHTRVVRDLLWRADGSLAEATDDWYAADNAGNVWYFGEDTATYKPDGQVESREGSWQAGVHGATAGLIMPAGPKATDAYRQELWTGHAEDQAWIVQNGAHFRVNGHRYRHVVRSYEWSRLEKANVSVKFYAPGVGIIRERDVAGGSEIFDLVKVTRP
jgi:hypothetical protein